MDKKEIQSIWAAFQEVQEKKKAPVTKKDDDGEGMDPVGAEDGDIDNDGDKDSSDEYLKNRRKKVGKEIEKDKEDVKEGELPPALKKNAEKKKKEDDKDEEEVEEEVECPKCKGEGCDHCDGKGYHMAKKETYSKKMKESSLFSEEELAALEEKMKQPNDDASAGEPFGSTNSEGEKKFARDHKKSDKKFEDMEDQSEKDASDAGKAVKSQSPTRRGEKRTGHLAMEKPSKAAGQ